MGSTNDIPRANDHALQTSDATPPRARPPGADHGLRWALTAMLSGLQEAHPRRERHSRRRQGQGQTLATSFRSWSRCSLSTPLVDSLRAEERALRAQLRAAKPAARALRLRLQDGPDRPPGSWPQPGPLALRPGAPRPPQADGAAEKALAAEKRRRTRALRRTKGPRQKAAIRFVGEPTLVLNPAEPVRRGASPSVGALFEPPPALAMIDPDTS